MWVGVGFAEGGCAVIPFRETEAGSATGDGVGFFEIHEKDDTNEKRANKKGVPKSQKRRPHPNVSSPPSQDGVDPC